jgi:hypothetical protein
MEKFKQFVRGLNKAEEVRLYQFFKFTIEIYLDQNVKNVDSTLRAEEVAAIIIEKLKQPPTHEEQILTLIDEFTEASKMAVEFGKGKDSTMSQIGSLSQDFKAAALSILSDNPILKAC